MPRDGQRTPCQNPALVLVVARERMGASVDYATAYVVRQVRRFSVAMTRVLYGEPIKEVIQRLPQRVSRIGVEPRYLLLDRGFCSVEVVRYLQAARYPFLMPVARCGRKPRHPEESESPWRFFAWKRSGWSEHRWRNAEGRLATVGICVVYGRFGKRGKRRRPQTFVYAYWGFRPASCEWVRETYRTRFAIERGFRQMTDVPAMRPIYHHCEPRVRAHIFVAALALLLERRLGAADVEFSAPEALQAASTIRLVTFQLDGRPPRRGTSSGSPRARQVLKALGITDLKPPAPQTDGETVM